MSSLLITNGHLVTLDQEDRFIENGKVYIEENRIVEVGDFASDSYTPERTIDARGSLVMPGLINAHHHLYSTFARGFTPAGPPAETSRKYYRTCGGSSTWPWIRKMSTTLPCWP